MKNSFKKEWDKQTQVSEMPTKLNKIITLEYEYFKSKIQSNDEEFANEIVSSLFAGNAYVIKNTLDADFLEELKQKTFKWGQENDSSYHECLEGSPNFNRVVDESLDGMVMYLDFLILFMSVGK